MATTEHLAVNFHSEIINQRQEPLEATTQHHFNYLTMLLNLEHLVFVTKYRINTAVYVSYLSTRYLTSPMLLNLELGSAGPAHTHMVMLLNLAHKL
jgi:hypothetical protein